MLKKGILLSVVLMLLVCSGAEARRRNVVVPTWYGYGVVSPYITGHQPYAWPAYGYSGMHPTYPASTAYYGAGVPAWNGSYWYYQASSLAVVANNLNVRAEPRVSGKKSRSNVIASLNTGEQVYVMGRYGNWSLVQSAYMPLRRGYVYSSYLRFYQGNWPASHYTAFYPVSLASAGW